MLKRKNGKKEKRSDGEQQWGQGDRDAGDKMTHKLGNGGERKVEAAT
jgi:hypothetical protein